jgi:formamidopyrimidine-DNA glycosylase
VFDSSVQRGQPATFPLNGVIKCWTEGVQLMKVGGKSRLSARPISRTATAGAAADQARRHAGLRGRAARDRPRVAAALVPELPEVEAARRVTAALAVGRRIVGVWCADDPIVFEGVTPRRVTAALRGRRVRAVRRHGKHFWLELDGRPWLLVHFGMTGGVHVPQRPSVRLKSSRDAPPPGWPPRFVKLRLTFDDGGELAIADGRRLGRIRLRHDPRREPPLTGLGFDALRELPPPARFHELLTARASPIKAVLLDQSFAAGVGNWIADEVLYQARIAPNRPRAHAHAAGVRAPALPPPRGPRHRGRARPTATASPDVALPPSLGPRPARRRTRRAARTPAVWEDGRRPHDRLGARRFSASFVQEPKNRTRGGRRPRPRRQPSTHGCAFFVPEESDQTGMRPATARTWRGRRATSRWRR